MKNTILALTLAAVATPTALPTIADARQRYYTTDNGVRYWRGEDGRYRCRRGNGTTGLLVGGAAGALVGRSIDGGRHHTTGTVLGAAAGALLGREVQRDRRAARCR